MSLDSQSQIKPESVNMWTSAGQRFNRKIDDFLRGRGLPDGHPQIGKFHLLRSTIDELCVAYERRNFSARQAQEDLKFRIKEAERQEETEMVSVYRQIWNLIDGRELNFL